VKGPASIVPALLLSASTLGACDSTQPGAAQDRIGFVRFVDQQRLGDIFVMNADGTGVINVTNTFGDQSDPDWSSDGSKIVFSEGGDVSVMNADGTGAHRLVPELQVPFGGYDSDPVWSPDGTRIAFPRIRGSTNTGFTATLYVMNSDGSGVTRLIMFRDTFGGIEPHPTWSPDGSRIAFIKLPYRLAGHARIYVINADGTEVRQLVDRGFDGVAWSPDGSTIAFGDRGIYVVNADGTALHRLASFGNDPAWSLDGSRIAFRGGDSSAPHIYVMDANGTHVHDLGPGSDPVWIPGGSPTPAPKTFQPSKHTCCESPSQHPSTVSSASGP
jgi:Tol biopolymer transport system component